MVQYKFCPRVIKRELPPSNLFEFTSPPVLFDDIGVDEKDAYFCLSDDSESLKIICYNFLAKTWRIITTCPVPEKFQGAIKVGNNLVANGISRYSTSIFIKRGNSPNFERMPCTGFVPPNYACVAIADEANNELYHITNTTLDIFKLDLNTLDWSLTFRGDAGHVMVRKWFDMILFESKIFLFGGTTDDFQLIGDSLRNLTIFDINTGGWSRRGTQGFRRSPNSAPIYPEPRSDCAVALVPETKWNNPYAVLYGGDDRSGNRTDMWRFDLKEGQWSPWRARFPAGFDQIGGGITPQGKIMIFNMQMDNSGIDDVMSMWPGIPNLSEIAWEAVLFYTPDLVKMPAVELRNFGIPQSFIQRIETRDDTEAIFNN